MRLFLNSAAVIQEVRSYTTDCLRYQNQDRVGELLDSGKSRTQLLLENLTRGMRYLLDGLADMGLQYVSLAADVKLIEHATASRSRCAISHLILHPSPVSGARKPARGNEFLETLQCFSRTLLRLFNSAHVLPGETGRPIWRAHALTVLRSSLTLTLARDYLHARGTEMLKACRAPKWDPLLSRRHLYPLSRRPQRTLIWSIRRMHASKRDYVFGVL
ncbi:hypothetical protein B0H12DRAFT_1330999 [Mycena haematopus]|nr:hypothetical protein B0H12DRAFT_1330999 [Mycena haematopus]